MTTSDKYLVLRGNKYIKTGSLVATKRNYLLKDKEAITLESAGRVLNPQECLDRYYGKTIKPYCDPNVKYDIIDDELIDWDYQIPKTYRNTIFHNCRISDLRFYDARLENVVFYMCRIDVLKFQRATLKNVSILHCGDVYGLRLEGADYTHIDVVGSTIKRPDNEEYDIYYTGTKSFQLVPVGSRTDDELRHASKWYKGRDKRIRGPRKPKPEVDLSDNVNELVSRHAAPKYRSKYDASDEEIFAALTGAPMPEKVAALYDEDEFETDDEEVSAEELDDFLAELKWDDEDEKGGD